MSATSDETALPGRAQVVIIGGGVIGTSVAYHLAKLGWTDVVLLERDQLTSGTTWHAAGLIVSGGMTTETLAWMTKYSTDLYTVLEDETGQSTGFKPVGYLQTASNPDRMHKLRREADFLRLMGIEREEISPARLPSCGPMSTRPVWSEGSSRPAKGAPIRTTWRCRWRPARGRAAFASCSGRRSPGSSETVDG